MVLLCSVCVPDPGPGFTTSLVMVLLCSVCVPDPGPGFPTSLVMVLLCSVCVSDPSQDLDFLRHVVVFVVFSELRLLVIVRFVDIGGYVETVLKVLYI
jgi:hypothetical protein